MDTYVLRLVNSGWVTIFLLLAFLLTAFGSSQANASCEWVEPSSPRISIAPLKATSDSVMFSRPNSDCVLTDRSITGGSTFTPDYELGDTYYGKNADGMWGWALKSTFGGHPGGRAACGRWDEPNPRTLAKPLVATSNGQMFFEPNIACSLPNESADPSGRSIDIGSMFIPYHNRGDFYYGKNSSGLYGWALMSTFGAPEQPPEQPPEKPPEQPPTVTSYGSLGEGSPSTEDCDYRITGDIGNAVAEAPAHSVGCVEAGNYVSQGVITISANDRTIRAVGRVELRGVVLKGVRLTLDGFRFTAQGEQIDAAIGLSGHGHRVLNNYINSANATFGIKCSDRLACSQMLIQRNTVTGIESIGIFIADRDHVVEWNNVYDLYRTSNRYDVDAMRFFGTGHRIRNNYFHDINEFKSVRSASGDTPHVDCWQTYTTFDRDGDPVETNDVIIENNYCVRISRQCLILENNRTTKRVVHGIVFRSNVCETFDNQVINLKGVEDIKIHNNFLGGLPKFQVIKLQRSPDAGRRDTRGVSIRNNILQDNSERVHPIHGDNPGGIAIDNIILERSPISVNSNNFQADIDRAYSPIQPEDFISFVKLNESLNSQDKGGNLYSPGLWDLAGRQRVQEASIDIGPYER